MMVVSSSSSGDSPWIPLYLLGNKDINQYIGKMIPQKVSPIWSQIHVDAQDDLGKNSEGHPWKASQEEDWDGNPGIV